MKSVSIFIVLMIILYTGLLTIDWLKSVVFTTDHHFLLIKMQTLFLVFSSVVIMKLTLPRQSFRFFILLYAGAWVIYFLLKISILAAGSELMFGTHTNPVLGIYLKFTQILSPLPLFAFWMLNRVFMLHVSPKQPENLQLKVTA